MSRRRPDIEVAPLGFDAQHTTSDMQCLSVMKMMTRLKIPLLLLLIREPTSTDILPLQKGDAPS